jgi:hypothetical protein
MAEFGKLPGLLAHKVTLRWDPPCQNWRLHFRPAQYFMHILGGNDHAQDAHS